VRADRLGSAEVAKVLGATAVFRGLPADVLAGLASICTQRTYGRGQYVYHQGDVGDRLFVLVDGLVKVVFASEQGDETVLATLRAGESFGELAVLDGGPRSASVVTVSGTRLLMITRAALLELMRTSPALIDSLLVGLGAMVRRLTEHVSDMSALDVGGRLAKLLLRLAKQEASGGRVVLNVPLSQSELAAMVGASRPVVNRILQSFAARGWLEVSGHVIVLHDVPALRRRAGL
jgi:CRP/FNR family transcriptional regulator, cyclic AMP receptor protein